MNIFRRFVRLFKTLLMIPVLLILKTISAVSVTLAVIVEGLGFAFFGSTFGDWLLGEISKKVAYVLLFAEETQLWILQHHVIANQKFLIKLGYVGKSYKSSTMQDWPNDVPVPTIDPTQVN